MPARICARSAACALAMLASCALAQAPAAEPPQQIFERAMAARARGDLHEAIQGFRTLLDRHPALSRARVELAVAYYHALDHRAALEEARRVLADPSTPPAVRANLERLVSQIEEEAQPHRWTHTVSLGWLHDSNVTAGPSSAGYEAGGTQLAVDAGAVKRSDSALSFAFGASHRWLSPLRPGIAGRDGALLWQSQAQINRLEYRRESAYNLQVLTLATGPAWISPPRLRAAAPMQYDRLELGGAHYLDVVGASPSVVFGGPLGLELQLEAQAQARGYRRQSEAGRDSRYRAAGAQVGRVIARLALQAGLRHHRDDADDAQWDYRGHEWFALLAGTFAERGSAYARLTRLQNRHDQPDALTGIGRTDRETRWSLGAAWRLSGTVQAPVALSLGLLEIRHASTVPLYGFDRRQITVTLSSVF